MSIPDGPSEWLQFVDLPRAVVLARIRNHLDRVQRVLERTGQQEATVAKLIRSSGGVPPSDSDPVPKPNHRAGFQVVVTRLEAIGDRVEDPEGVETEQLRKDALFAEIVADELEAA